MKIVINVALAQCILCYFGYFFTSSVGGIGAYFVYFHWYLKKDVTQKKMLLKKRCQIFTKHINGKN